MPNKRPKYVIIVAGGKGTRMQSEIPKQFLSLLGKPILMHTLQVFRETDKNIRLIVVLPVEQRNTWQKLIELQQFDVPHLIVDGGESRFHSVKNGLKHVPDHTMVAIHDGVRPLVNPAIVTESYQLAEAKGSAVVTLPLKDSIRRLGENESSFSCDRSFYRSVQTPQTFKSEIIKQAYQMPYSPQFTDCASVLEKFKDSSAIYCLEGNEENIKVTTPTDLLVAEAILKIRTTL